LSDAQKFKNRQKNQAKSVNVKGEESASSSAPNPGSDDNVLDAAQKAGLYNDADPEDPVKINIADKLNQAAGKRRGAEKEKKEKEQSLLFYL
jgi:hypothetical protein